MLIPLFSEYARSMLIGGGLLVIIAYLVLFDAESTRLRRNESQIGMGKIGITVVMIFTALYFAAWVVTALDFALVKRDGVLAWLLGASFCVLLLCLFSCTIGAREWREENERLAWRALHEEPSRMLAVIREQYLIAATVPFAWGVFHTVALFGLFGATPVIGGLVGVLLMVVAYVAAGTSVYCALKK